MASLVGENALEERQIKPFREVHASDLGSYSLQDEIASRGYLLIRDLLPQHTLSQVLRDIMRILYTAGRLVRDDDPLERMADIGAACGDPDPSFKRTYQSVLNLESFHALPHHPALKQVMRRFIGENILIHPKPIGRLILPRCERLVNRAHQDFRFMDGELECFTAWIPLHDCPTRLGPCRFWRALTGEGRTLESLVSRSPQRHPPIHSRSRRSMVQNMPNLATDTMILL